MSDPKTVSREDAARIAELLCEIRGIDPREVICDAGQTAACHVLAFDVPRVLAAIGLKLESAAPSQFVPGFPGPEYWSERN